MKYIHAGGRDGKAAREMLDHCGGDMERFSKAVSQFLASEDEFLITNRHPMWAMANSPVRWFVDPVAVAPKPLSPLEQFRLRQRGRFMTHDDRVMGEIYDALR